MPETKHASYTCMKNNTNRSDYFKSTVHKIEVICILFAFVLLGFLYWVTRQISLQTVIGLTAIMLLMSPVFTYLYIDYKMRVDDSSDPMHPERKLAVNGTYGTARLEEPWEYRGYAQIRQIEKCNGIILGQLTDDGTQCVDLFPDPHDPKVHINYHICAFGSSGSGKTFTYVKCYCYQAIKKGHSIIHTDPKGELFRDLANLYRKHGYVVRRINFIHPKKSDGWDCLKSIREEKDLNNMQVLVDTFASSVVSNAMGKVQPAYYAGALLLLKALILRVILDPDVPEEKKIISTVYEDLANPGGIKYLENLFSEENICEATRPAQAVYTMFRSASENFGGNICISLGAAIQVLGTGLISHMLSFDEIDLGLPGDKPCAYFVQFPVPNLTYAFPTSLFFTMLFKTLTDKAISSPSGKLKVEVDFMMDEFAQCGVIPGWEQYISVIRSYGINIFMILQSIGQFSTLYRESYNTIIGNCSTWLAIGINDMDTAKYFAERCGKASYESQSISRQGLRKLLGIKNRVVDRITQGTGQGYLLNPDELTRLESNTSLIIFMKHNPVYVNSVANTLHPYAKECTPALDEQELEIFDIEAKISRNKAEMEYADNYLSTHKKFVPPSNIDDAPYKEKPLLSQAILDVYRQDFQKLLRQNKKTSAKKPSHSDSSKGNSSHIKKTPKNNTEDEENIITDEDNINDKIFYNANAATDSITQALDIDMSDCDDENDNEFVETQSSIPARKDFDEQERDPAPEIKQNLDFSAEGDQTTQPDNANRTSEYRNDNNTEPGVSAKSTTWQRIENDLDDVIGDNSDTPDDYISDFTNPIDGYMDMDVDPYQGENPDIDLSSVVSADNETDSTESNQKNLQTSVPDSKTQDKSYIKQSSIQTEASRNKNITTTPYSNPTPKQNINNNYRINKPHTPAAANLYCDVVVTNEKPKNKPPIKKH